MDYTMPEDYELLVEFTDHSPSFCHGFEVGVCWELLGRNLQELQMEIHPENRSVVTQIAKIREYVVDFSASSRAGWLEARFLATWPCGGL